MDKYTPQATANRSQFISVQFQEGPIPEVGVNGCHIEDVIQVAIDRIRSLNVPPLNCRENSLAITHLEEAQNWLMRRTLDRVNRSVEGSMQP